MRRLPFVILLTLGVLAGAMAFAPLSLVLETAGARRSGLDWTSASGTLLDGRLEGLEANGDDYGNVALRLKPEGLFSGSLQFAVDWTGPSGRGAGQMAIGPVKNVTLREYDLDLDLMALEQAARWIQQSGGRVSLQGDMIRFANSVCVEARGIAQSDVLERNRAILGDGWSEMRGELRCEAGDLLIPLESVNATGTMFGAHLRIRPGLPGRFEARVSGLVTRELDYVLPLAGFRREGSDYVYSYSVAAGRQPI